MTFGNGKESPLTLEKIREAKRLLDKLGRTPFFIYFHYVDSVYYGEAIDSLAERMDSFFDRGLQKAYLAPFRLKGTIEGLKV